MKTCKLGSEMRRKRTLKKWAWGKSVERWEKTSSMCFEASHHEAQKCRTTGTPLWTNPSSSFFDCTSFTDPPIDNGDLWILKPTTTNTERERKAHTFVEAFISAANVYRRKDLERRRSGFVGVILQLGNTWFRPLISMILYSFGWSDSTFDSLWSVLPHDIDGWGWGCDLCIIKMYFNKF